MAQKRMISKSISLSRQVNNLSLKHAFIFSWCLPHLDDYGRIDNDPEIIKATVCPLKKEITIRDCKEFIEKAGSEKDHSGVALINVYQDCIEFPGFENHNSLSDEKRAKSRFLKIPKNPQEDSGESENPQESPLQYRIGEYRIGEDRCMSASEASPDAFTQFWNAYPKKELKKKSKEIWKKNKLNEQIAVILVFIEKAKLTDRWKKGFIKQPPVFLRNEVWNDDLNAYGDIQQIPGKRDEETRLTPEQVKEYEELNNRMKSVTKSV